MDCSKITKGFVVASCDNLPTGGTGSKVYLFNYADIDRSSSTKTKQTISVIALKDGAKGYQYESFDNSTDGSATLNKGTYVSNYDHQVQLRLFAEDEDAREFLADAKEARIVAVVQKKGSVEFEVYGWESGLKMSENAYATKYTDNVAYAPIFKSDDNSKESDLPYICSMTEAALNALCQTQS